MIQKRKLRAKMRKARRAHEVALPEATRGLMFLRPPTRIADLAPVGSVVGIYHAVAPEAPTLAYAQWFYENGRRLALPWFEHRDTAMQFRFWRDPWDDALLEPGPYGGLQPHADAEEIVPDLTIVPLLAFTADGHRLGQGGGHYDRWHAAHPLVPAIGLAWDCQRVDTLPLEPHDHALSAVITPTRLYEGA
ncbi:MAG: 5-formyltetrahydrofolate cyclo-ligase [Novosphingobium sp.]